MNSEDILVNSQSVVISGLPESGKTTYLAALWQLITYRSLDTKLRFKSLRNGDSRHLNALAKRWRDTKTQRRTEQGADEIVSMNLIKEDNESIRVVFPDLSGESIREMWEARDCTDLLSKTFSEGNGMMMFINADQIKPPLLTVSVAEQSAALGLKIPEGQYKQWTPRLAPTQVQIVDLLQLLRQKPLSVKFSKLVIILSAWDKVEFENLKPSEFLTTRLPLLHQYLESTADGWIWSVYGISAQGGEYINENVKPSKKLLAEVEKLRLLDDSSKRIKVVTDASESHDLTEPLAWLVQ